MKSYAAVVCQATRRSRILSHVARKRTGSVTGRATARRPTGRLALPRRSAQRGPVSTAFVVVSRAAKSVNRALFRGQVSAQTLHWINPTISRSMPAQVRSRAMGTVLASWRPGSRAIPTANVRTEHAAARPSNASRREIEPRPRRLTPAWRQDVALPPASAYIAGSSLR